MGEDASVMQAGNSTMLTKGQSDHEKKVVTITLDSSQTKIAMVHRTASTKLLIAEVQCVKARGTLEP